MTKRAWLFAFAALFAAMVVSLLVGLLLGSRPVTWLVMFVLAAGVGFAMYHVEKRVNQRWPEETHDAQARRPS